jgi:hypothetical protein
MRVAALLLTATILTPQQSAAQVPSRPFEEWLQELIAEAHSRGYSDELIDATLSGLTPIPRVVERDSSQAEFTITLDRYFQTRVTPRIIRLGREQAMEQSAVLRRIRSEYGVSQGVVLAIWGLESHYGGFTGAYPVFQALATLASEPRRSDFFRNELFKALSIVAGGYRCEDDDRVVGGRDGPAAVHAVELSRARGRFRQRRPARHLALEGGHARLDCELFEGCWMGTWRDLGTRGEGDGRSARTDRGYSDARRRMFREAVDDRAAPARHLARRRGAAEVRRAVAGQRDPRQPR